MRSGLCMKKKKNHKTFRHPACRAVSSDRMRRGETERESPFCLRTPEKQGVRNLVARRTARRTKTHRSKTHLSWLVSLVRLVQPTTRQTQSPVPTPGAGAGVSRRWPWDHFFRVHSPGTKTGNHRSRAPYTPKPLRTLLPGSLKASTCLAEALGAVRCPRDRATRCVGPGISYFGLSALSGTCKSEDS